MAREIGRQETKIRFFAVGGTQNDQNGVFEHWERIGRGSRPYDVTNRAEFARCNLVPRVFSLFKMAAARGKSQPRPQGLLAFQNDPGTQQITCLQRGWRCTTSSPGSSRFSIWEAGSSPEPPPYSAVVDLQGFVTFNIVFYTLASVSHIKH